MVRVKVNPSLPYDMTIMKHTGWIATERTVKAHESRADGKAISESTGYQSNYRYGSHQSITRNWLMPMHQTDTLFHKKTGGVGFTSSASPSTTTASTPSQGDLVRITKAEAGGEGGSGVWYGAKTGRSPGNPDAEMRRYLAGALTTVEG